MPKGQRLSLAEALRAARDTRVLEIGDDILGRTPQIVRDQFGESSVIIVSDRQTMTAAGDAVADAFRAAGLVMVEPFLFDDADLYAEHRFMEKLATSLRQHSAIPVAVGSGTINDLTKLAACRSGRPYLCVATAASMDGYTAFGASITHEGSKQTFECPAPAAVVADLKIIGAAPAEMNAWGYADLMGKVTAGADWMVADALGVEAIDATAWSIAQGGLRDALDDSAALRSRDSAAMKRLVEGLMLAGLAMQAMKSSRPASGAEHQFSHLWDMQHHTHEGSAPAHGLKVGIGTLAVTALYEALLAQPLENLDVDRCCAAWPSRAKWIESACHQFGDPQVQTVAVREIQAKHSTHDELRQQLEQLRKAWPELRVQLRAQLFPLATLKSKLQAAGAATEPEQIGISRERLRRSFWQALYIRRRFTVLDLAARTATLDTLLDEIFGPDGPWELAAVN